jgi:hypothetical protein
MRSSRVPMRSIPGFVNGCGASSATWRSPFPGESPVYAARPAGRRGRAVRGVASNGSSPDGRSNRHFSVVRALKLQAGLRACENRRFARCYIRRSDFEAHRRLLIGTTMDFRAVGGTIAR